MVERRTASCEYLLDGKLCKAIIEGEEGKAARKELCVNEQKDICCRLCDDQSSCDTSCNYVGKSEKSGKNLRARPQRMNIVLIPFLALCRKLGILATMAVLPSALGIA